MAVGLIVPVYKNFEGLTKLIHSVDTEVHPFIIPNWERNIGVSKGWNDGLRRAIAMECPFALISNDDIVLAPHTIRKLMEGMIFNDYDLLTAINTRDYAVAEGYGNAPDFSCFMVRPKEFTDKFGWFDENFTPAYFEDNDMHYRIRLQDGKAGCRLDAAMYHAGSVTQNWEGFQVVTPPMFERNRSYYAKKWGGWPGAESFTVPFNGEKK